MRVIIAMLACGFVAGCSPTQSAEIQDCEARLLRNMKTPSTYKPQEKTSILVASGKYKYQNVSIKYDAQNEYGALVRNEAACLYPVDGVDIRIDLAEGDDSETSDATEGRGYYSPHAKFPSRAEVEARRQAETGKMLNETD
jgi:hypothetical protein